LHHYPAIYDVLVKEDKNNFKKDAHPDTHWMAAVVVVSVPDVNSSLRAHLRGQENPEAPSECADGLIELV
jgi:hypothetical protein